jgi:hypothetical protein
MVRRNISQLCCLIVLVSSIHTPLAQAQGMGMGGMGMGGRGMGGMGNNSNDPPPEPEKPAVKFNPFAADAAPVQGMEARTAALEKFIFGHPEKNPKMKVRVERLEKKLVPYEHHKGDGDLEKRVDHLWSVLEAGNKGSTKQAQDSKNSKE